LICVTKKKIAAGSVFSQEFAGIDAQITPKGKIYRDEPDKKQGGRALNQRIRVWRVTRKGS
jgi:hypothetical protein